MIKGVNTLKTAYERAKEFDDNMFTVINEKLYCNLCSTYVKHNPLGNIILHLRTKKHKMNESTCQNILALKEEQMEMSVYEEKHFTILEFTRMLVNCNIPFAKVKHMRDWIGKHVINGGAIPNYQAISGKYLKIVFQQEEEKLKKMLKTCYISIGVDSTPDGRGKNLINAIFYTSSSKVVLAHCKFVVSENAESLIEFLDEAVTRYSHWDRCLSLISDNASKNTKCFQHFINNHNSKILHLRCSQHIINLVLKEVTHNDYFDIAFEYVSALQTLFNHSTNKKNAFKQYLASLNVKYERFEGYVESRWCSFLHTCTHLVKYYDYYNMYLKNEDTRNCKSIKKIMNMLNHSYVDILWKINVIADFAHAILPVTTALDSNESQIFRLSSMLSNIIVYLNKILYSSSIVDDIGMYTANFMKIYSVEDINPNYNIQIRQAVTKGIEKLKDYMMYNEDFFRAILVFNPTLKLNLTKNVEYYFTHINILHMKRSKDLERELEVYLNTDLSQEEIKSMKTYWYGVKHIFPNLFECFIILHNIPVSNTVVERTFSMLRTIFTDERSGLGEDNIAGLLKYKVNNSNAFLKEFKEFKMT